eukprot:GHVN01086701.1.p1 GENE.GHVN01086701.1~~GHVN01086701.1.p1  ORF type:complete len:123 (-),score=31.65 GHVN01086701.1:455-823(-)
MIRKSQVSSQEGTLSGEGRQHRQSNLSPEQLAELQDAFNLFDTNKSGAIDASEMKAVLRALGFEVKRDDVRRMFNEVGKEVSEPILFQEFCKLMDGRMTKTLRKKSKKCFSCLTKTAQVRYQ